MRQRSGIQRFGIQGLEPGFTQLVEGDSLLILRTIILAEASNAGLEAARDAKGSVNSEAGVPSGWVLFSGLVHPEDPWNTQVPRRLRIRTRFHPYGLART